MKKRHQLRGGSSDDTGTITTMVPRDVKRALNAIARRSGVPKQVVYVEAIQQFLTRRGL
jgi:predicted transcriptional regulator